MIPHHPIRARGQFSYKRRPACMITEEACTNKNSQCKEIPVELTPTGFVAHFDRIYITKQEVQINLCYINNSTCCPYLAHEGGICMMEHQAPLLNSIHKREEEVAAEGETTDATEEEERTEETDGESTETTPETEAKKDEQPAEAKTEPETVPKAEIEMDKKSVKPIGRIEGQREEEREKKFHDGDDGLYNVGDSKHPYKLPLCVNAPGTLACVVLDRERDRHHHTEHHGYNNHHDGEKALFKAPQYDFHPYISKDGTHPDVNGNRFEVDFENEHHREHEEEKRVVTPQ